MPFKIPRLDSNASSQTSLIPETATFFSQNDSQFYVGSSQQSRDSAYGASQPDKNEVASFWNSLRGSREPECKSVDSATSSAVVNQRRLFDEIDNTVNEIDAILTKKLCPEKHKETPTLEKVDDIRTSLESCLRSMDSMIAFDTEVQEFANKATEKIDGIRDSVSKLIAVSPQGSPALDTKTPFLEMKLKCFASTMDFLVNMAKQKMSVPLKHQRREQKPPSCTSRSSGSGSFFRQAWGTPNPAEEPVEKSSNIRQLKNLSRLPNLTYGSCITRKTPLFAINIIGQGDRLNNTICTDDRWRSARPSNIRRAQTSSKVPQEQIPVVRSTPIQRFEPSVVHNDRARPQNPPVDYSQRNSLESFFRPTSADSSDSEDCISLGDFVLNEE